MSKYTKAMFQFMKDTLGLWKQYDTYEDYQKGEYKIGQTPEEHTEDFKNWHENLPEQEKKDFDRLFGE